MHTRGGSIEAAEAAQSAPNGVTVSSRVTSLVDTALSFFARDYTSVSTSLFLSLSLFLLSSLSFSSLWLFVTRIFRFFAILPRLLPHSQRHNDLWVYLNSDFRLHVDSFASYRRRHRYRLPARLENHSRAIAKTTFMRDIRFSYALVLIAITNTFQSILFFFLLQTHCWWALFFATSLGTFHFINFTSSNPVF